MSQTIVITGGSKGIGAAIASYFCEKGDSVVIGARQDNGFAASLGPRARFQAMDAADPAGHARLVETALQWTGRLDIYINNAGQSHWMPLDEITEKFWQEMLDVNTKSVLFGCQQAARAMASGGCIINISSLAAKRGTANNSVYCAAKFAVNGITQALAKELGPRGIRVNALCPVLVATPGLLEALKDPAGPAQGKPEEFLAGFAKANAALRGALPTAEQVAEFCYLLAGATAITGQCINVDCGVLPQ
jgi:3-oxoacyl-[acyl-carrier protein] reductase/meso-butanediol dehydrogenase/(S,S)-butanediol dehydrogenase/diacetyl reductase